MTVMLLTLKQFGTAVLCTGTVAILGGSAPATPGPRAEVPVASFDAGPVPASQPVRHDYVIKNTGDAPLTIKDVKPG